MSVCRQTENGSSISGYSHLTVDESDRLAGFLAAGLSLRAIARALGRAASTISRELRRNALESGAYRPHPADGAHMLRRQRQARLETDLRLAACVTDRLSEGWTPDRIAGRLRLWTDLDAFDQADIQEIAMTINFTPLKRLGYRSPVEASLTELGRDVEIRFA